MTTVNKPEEEILQRPVLELKSFAISDPDTERIYSSTLKAIERFNMYVEDFFQTREILLEQLETLSHADDLEKQKEYTESLKQVIMRITEIRTAMEEMALHMSSFVSLRLIG